MLHYFQSSRRLALHGWSSQSRLPLKLSCGLSPSYQYRSKSTDSHHVPPPSMESTKVDSNLKQIADSLSIQDKIQLRKILKEKLEENSSSFYSDITKRDYLLLFLRGMVPYIGFGVCDNSLMIIFGDLIDQKLGVRLSISTMAAAGLGNLVSCSSGVLTGGLIDRFASKLGLPEPNISGEQARSSNVKTVSLTGNLIGIIIGCLLGMFPLLFLEPAYNSHHVHGNAPISDKDEGAGK